MLKERLIQIIDISGLSAKTLEQLTNVDRDRWRNMISGKIRVGEDHIEAAVKQWPQYAYWLTTGKTIPEAGQISPEIEEARKNSPKAGQAG